MPTTVRRGLCEALEARRLLAAAMSTNPANLLVVNGDDDPNFPNDTILLTRVYHSGADKIKVIITTGAGTTKEYLFPEANVAAVRVDVGDGNNRAEWQSILNWVGRPTTMIGGTGHDTLIGGRNNDSLVGDLGNDSLVGSDGDDTMDASAGNDTLMGGYGADLYLGGNHIDTADYTDMGNAVYVTLDDVADDGFYVGAPGTPSTEGDNVATSVERVRGTNATYSGDYIVGSGKDNLIYGNAGDDTLIGYGGLDTIWGGAGNDSIDGGSGNDSLIGEAGADLLLGSGDNDVLEAAGDSTGDTLVGGSGTDGGNWDLIDTLGDLLPG